MWQWVISHYRLILISSAFRESCTIKGIWVLTATWIFFKESFSKLCTLWNVTTSKNEVRSELSITCGRWSKIGEAKCISDMFWTFCYHTYQKMSSHLITEEMNTYTSLRTKRQLADIIGCLFLEIMTKSCICCHHIFFSVLLLLPAPSFFKLSSCARLNIATAHFFNYLSLTNLTGAFHWLVAALISETSSKLK